MTGEISKTQIDLLGDRLRDGTPADADLRMLDDYRRSFGTAYEFVVQIIRQNLSLEPTGRPTKSTGAVMEKLHRETIRLSQVQDIAGCRIIVEGPVEQERVVEALRVAFAKTTVVDRRASPSYGYRAVHVIVDVSGRLVRSRSVRYCSIPGLRSRRNSPMCWTPLSSMVEGQTRLRERLRTVRRLSACSRQLRER